MYDRALRLAPADVATVSNRALALRGLRRHEEAVAACERALALRADHIDSLSNLGIIYKEMRDFEAAREVYERALAIAPGHAIMRVNLATLLMEMGRTDDAAEIAEALVAEQPELAEPWNVLHYCWFERGDFARADECTREACDATLGTGTRIGTRRSIRSCTGTWPRGSGNSNLASGSMSVVFMQPPVCGAGVGRLAAGWALDIRARRAGARRLDPIRPLRETAEGARCRTRDRGVLVRGHRAAPAPSNGIDELVVARHAASAVRRARLPHEPADAARARRSTTIPAHVPYVTAPSRPVAQVVRDCGERPPGGARVGRATRCISAIVVRSLSLEALAPVLGTEGVTFYSLQKGPPARQLSTLQGANIVNLDPRLHDLADTAAAIGELDLVITVDTAIAHLAGALGKPVWVLLPHVPDWRWMLAREDSPWYPTMRLFRQPAVKAWEPAIASRRARAGRAPRCEGARRRAR